MLLKFALGTIVAFGISAMWLYLAWSNGNRTNDWVAVPAVVTRNDMHKTLRNRPAGWATTVEYTVDGDDYEALLDEYLTGNTEVFVNPEDPTQVVGKQGARMQSLGRPIVATVGTGLFAVVLLLIAVSPNED